jgi:hypothetical protein
MWCRIVKVIDAAIYFWIPQINIILLRLCQGRNLLHRMVARTVVIGDIPWVAQSAEAFLSKVILYLSLPRYRPRVARSNSFVTDLCGFLQYCRCECVEW